MLNVRHPGKFALILHDCFVHVQGAVAFLCLVLFFAPYGDPLVYHDVLMFWNDSICQICLCCFRKYQNLLWCCVQHSLVVVLFAACKILILIKCSPFRGPTGSIRIRGSKESLPEVRCRSPVGDEPPRAHVMSCHVQLIVNHHPQNMCPRSSHKLQVYRPVGKGFLHPGGLRDCLEALWWCRFCLGLGF